MSFELGVNLAMIGDEDITFQIQLESYPSYGKIKYLEYFYERFADTNEVIRLADKALENEHGFDMIMLFPVLWDIIYMEFDEFYMPSVHLKGDNNTLDNLVSLISSAQKRWKVTYPNVTIFWCMPFTPDFYRFNRSDDFWKEQDTGRNFYRIIRKLGSDLYANISGINLLDLHECYFLEFSVCENSFYQNIDEPLRYIHSCTKDGLHITKEFISNFVSVFEKRVYSVCLDSNRKYNLSDSSSSTNYDHRRPLNMRVFDYSTPTFKSIASENMNFKSDHHQISQQYYADKDNTVPERSLSESRNFHTQSNNYPSNNLNYSRDSQTYPHHSNDPDSYRNWQTQSSHHFKDENYCEDSNTSNVQSNDNSNQNEMNKYLPDGSNNSFTDKKNDTTSSRSLMEELSSFLKSEDSNASDSITKYQQQNIPQNNLDTSWEDLPSISHQSPPPSSSLKYSEVKQNIGNDIFKGLSNIPSNIFDNLKNALNFLGSSNITNNKISDSSNVTDNKDSGFSNITNNKESDFSNITDNKDSGLSNITSHVETGYSDSRDSKDLRYYESYINNFFSPFLWKDLFINGDENVALDCLKASVNSLNKIPYKKGIVIVMVTNSEDLVSRSLESLKSLVESNTIGLNDEITFGAPLILIDTASNIKLRLNQIKQQSLCDLSALLVFGDDLLDMSSLLFIELTNLVKQLLNSCKGDVNKVVISQSGSADLEVSAQSIFNVTFISPKRQIDKEKEEEKFNNRVSLTDFLKNSSVDLEISNDSHSSFHNSSLAPVGKKQDPVLETHVSRVSSKDKSSKTHEAERKKSSSRHKSPPQKSRSSHSSTSSKPTVKLEDIFMQARISIPEEKKKENDAKNKEFMKKLGKMPSSVQKAYMAEGKEVLMDHDSTYKTYKDVPDLHPLYEDKYELFIKLFEEAYGQNYNPKHLQTSWKRFWVITVSCIKDLEWLDKKREFQEKFMVKHGMKGDVMIKEDESDNTRNGKSEIKKIKPEETKKKITINKSEVSDKKATKVEGNKVKIKEENIKEHKMTVIKSEKIDKKTTETEGNKVNTMKSDVEKIEVIKKATSTKEIKTEGNNVKTAKDEGCDENKKTINKLAKSGKKMSGTEGNNMKATKDEAKVDKNKETEVKLEKAKEIPKVEGKERNDKDIKSQFKYSNKKEDKDDSKLKKRSSSPGPLENISKKAKTDEIKLPKSKVPPSTNISDKNSPKVASGEDESSVKIFDHDEIVIISDSENDSEVKDFGNSLKTVVEMRRKLIMDAEKEDMYSFAVPDSKANEKKPKKDLGNDSKENLLSKMENIKTTSSEKKSPPEVENKSRDEDNISNQAIRKTDSLTKEMNKFIEKNSLNKSRDEDNIYNQAIRKTDSLTKEMNKFIEKNSQFSEKKSLSKSDSKSSKEKFEIRDRYSSSEKGLEKSLSYSRRGDDNHSSSSHYKQLKKESLTRKEDKYYEGDRHSKLDSKKRKSHERDDFHATGTSTSDKRKALFNRDNFQTNTKSDVMKRNSYEKDNRAGKESDTDRRKSLHKRESRSSFSRDENLTSRKGESAFSHDRKEDKPSNQNSLAHLISSKADLKSNFEPEQKSLSSLLSSLKEKTSATASLFSAELSSSAKPLFPIQIPQSKLPASTFKNKNQPQTKEDFMNLYVNTCSELSKKKSPTNETSTSSNPTSISEIMKDLDSLVKPSSSRSPDQTKSKILINLGKPKMQFSLYEALNSLESVCSDIGVMGAALNSIVKSSRDLLPNFYEAYKIFTDPDSELLVNIAINKLKSFSARSAGDKVKYQKTIALAEKLLEEAKKSTLKGPPPSAHPKPAVKSRINVEAVAKATLGLDVKDVCQFIKNTFVYKGLSEPSKSEIEQVFEEVSRIHFRLSVNT